MAPGDVSPWWAHVLVKKDCSNGTKQWECNFCGLERTGAADRVRNHLLGTRGKGITTCRKVPPEKLSELEALANSEGRQVRTKVHISSPIFGGSSVAAPVGCSSLAGPSTNRFFAGTSGGTTQKTTQPIKIRQVGLQAAWEPGLKAKTDAAVGRFFYRNAISFNAARTSSYREMVDAIKNAGPSYMPPGYDAIRERLLVEERANIDAGLGPIREDWENFGVSLMADGWSDVRKRSMQGILGYSRGRTYFVKSIDNSEGGKSAARLFEIWDEAVQTVGEKNVLQFVADGENSNRTAGKLLMEKYPGIYFTPCMAHCINNLLKDVGKLKWVAPLINDGKEICNFIFNHHYILALFRRFGTKELLKYSDTRFAYNFLMLQRLHEQRHTLMKLVLSEEWHAWPLHTSAAAEFVSSRILDKKYWDDVAHNVEVTEPMVVMMRLVDGEEPCYGKVYEGMDKMSERVMQIETNKEHQEVILELASNRWWEYYTPLQAAGYMVDPEFQHKRQYADEEVVTGWEEVLHRFVPDATTRRKIKDQLSHYRKKEGLFGSEDAQRDRFLRSSALWWEEYGASARELQEIAVRILSHGCSSSPCERLWSSFGNIATKKRNRLGVQKADDLVFVNANLRLIEQRSTNYKIEVFNGFEEGEVFDEDSDAME